MGFQFTSFGPMTRGVIDAANPHLDLKGAVRKARNAVVGGALKVNARPGHQLALTLKDDQGSPANVTSVVALQHFSDGCLAVGHSTITDKFYLYWLNDEMNNWYNSSKVLQGTLTPLPVGVLWSSALNPERVTIAEGLGFAYIAHNDAGTSFQTRKFDTTVSPATLTDFQADLRGSGLENTFFRGVVSFQQHLWGWGYRSQAAGENDRPEFLRFSQPFFGPMVTPDGFAVGHRVRSSRERIIAAVVAGEVLYVGLRYALWPITGFGRNSWDKARPLDDSYGFAGLYSAIAAANGWLYYWSVRGPMRVFGLARPDPLFKRIEGTLPAVVDPRNVVATYDPDHDQVVWLYQDQTSGRVSRLAAYDVMADMMLGPDGDVGLGIFSATIVQPVALPGPAGAPSIVSTTGIGNTIATGNYTVGDPSPQVTTELEIREVGTTPWTVAATGLPVTQTSYQFTGLLPGKQYEWRIRHRRNGQPSAYDGPEAASTFTTTTNQLAPPTNCAMEIVITDPIKGTFAAIINWQNSGEAGARTEVYFEGPVGSPPASGTLDLFTTVEPGVSSAQRDIGFALGDFYAEVRHVRDGFTPSVFSNMATASNPS